jgi:DNA-binding Lrp family transcriptional regulator|tara:strand:+ start:8677 stop:9147 length:471 start_codon:yes stop_codon:yes gene_type:complete
MKITKKDIQITSHLRRNSREMLTKLSRRTGIPVSTIFDRIKLHNGGFIKRNTTLIDFQLLGFNSRAKVILKVERSDRDELKDYLKRHNHINSLYRINNGYDFMFEAIFRNMKDLEDFIMSLEEQYKILNKHIYYVIDNIKQEDFLSRDDAIDIAFK